jgi:hypothetical protein
LSVLEIYFVRPETLDRISASWIGSQVEQYVGWLADQGYSARTVLRRVPQVLAFGEFARQQGAQGVTDLPAHVNAYVAKRVSDHRGERQNGSTAQQVAKEVRGPVEQLLRLVVPDFNGQRLRRLLPGRRADQGGECSCASPVRGDDNIAERYPARQAARAIHVQAQAQQHRAVWVEPHP